MPVWFKIAIGGHMALLVGMGLGRFSYTPMVPALTGAGPPAPPTAGGKSDCREGPLPASRGPRDARPRPYPRCSGRSAAGQGRSERRGAAQAAAAAEEGLFEASWEEGVGEARSGSGGWPAS